MKVLLTLVQFVSVLFGLLCGIAFVEGSSDPAMLPIVGLFLSVLIFGAAGRWKKNLRDARRHAEDV
jgi:hypothetical protein